MSNPSLNNKTIRPGSLSGYSYYYSSRQAPAPATSKPATKRHVPSGVKKVVITLIAIAAIIGVPMLRQDNPSDTISNQTSGSSASSAAAISSADSEQQNRVVASAVNHCAGNSASKFIKISVSERHLWACEGEKAVHDAPVITGMLMHPETLTPPGTYQIYAKQQDTRLTGADSEGSWDYPVSYWMPFLDNQHGTYGFHDATWRPESDFGAVDPNTKKASHGCIELPLSDMAWLYAWAPAETTLTVVN